MAHGAPALTLLRLGLCLYLDRFHINSIPREYIYTVIVCYAQKNLQFAFVIATVGVKIILKIVHIVKARVVALRYPDKWRLQH